MAPARRVLLALLVVETSSLSPQDVDRPLVSLTVPGASSVRVEVPGAQTLSRLSKETLAEVETLGVGSLLRRAVSAQVALSETVLRAMTRREGLTSATAARALRELFERLGSAYVKMGQLIASSPSAFPAEIVSEFEACLDAAPPVNFEEIREVVEDSLGRRLTEAFVEFDEKPLATASVAQVHGARLRDGPRVVVKVRKPGVADSLRCDLAVLNVAAKWLTAFAPEMRRVDPAGLAEELRNSVESELDFRLEAGRLLDFRAFLERNGLDSVAAVPYPIADLSTDAVLTMTRLDGSPLAEADENEDAKATVANLVRIWALSVVHGPFFHADLHAGNVLLLEDGKTLGLLDFGVVGRLPPETYDAVLRMADAYRDRDARSIAAALRDMGVATKTLNLDVLTTDIDAVVFADQSQASPADLLASVVDVAERNALVLPREFSQLVKQALYLDRFTSALAPDLDVFSDPRRALEQAS